MDHLIDLSRRVKRCVFITGGRFNDFYCGFFRGWSSNSGEGGRRRGIFGLSIPPAGIFAYRYMLFCTLKASQAELRVLKIVLAIILCSTVVDALS